MLQFLSKRWWKWISILLLTLAFCLGLLIPLGPGITRINPDRSLSGNVANIGITGYNTHFLTAQHSLRFYLKSNDITLCGNTEKIHNEHYVTVSFQLPYANQLDQNREFFSLIAFNEKDGTILLRKGFMVEKNPADSAATSLVNCNEMIQIKTPSGITFPYREILYESIRNLFFHVPMWFSMILLLLFSFVSSIRFLATDNYSYDVMSSSFAAVALFFGMLGILTGMQWANFTWGAPWINDPKLNGAAVGMLIYLAYFVLRSSLQNEQTRARVSAVYNIFSFVIFIVFIFIIPRMSDSLHPGSGGNPGFNAYDLDHTMRPVFYASVLGFTGIAYWIASIITRYRLIKQQIDYI